VTLKEDQVAIVNPDGSLHGLSVKQKATTGAGSALSVDSDHASRPAVLVKGAGDLLDLQTVAGTSRFKVTNAGTTTLTGPVTVSPAATTGVALIVQGLASQSADPFQVQDSAGSELVSVTAAGELQFGGDSLAAWSRSGASTIRTDGHLYAFGTLFAGGSGMAGSADTGRVNVDTATASSIGVVIRARASQTGDLFQTQDSTNAVLLAVTAAGLPQWKAAGNQQTTVGAAGGASALPATPTKYLKIVDSAGTTLVIPAYAAS